MGAARTRGTALPACRHVIADESVTSELERWKRCNNAMLRGMTHLLESYAANEHELRHALVGIPAAEEARPETLARLGPHRLQELRGPCDDGSCSMRVRRGCRQAKSGEDPGLQLQARQRRGEAYADAQMEFACFPPRLHEHALGRRTGHGPCYVHA